MSLPRRVRPVAAACKRVKASERACSLRRIALSDGRLQGGEQWFIDGDGLGGGFVDEVDGETANEVVLVGVVEQLDLERLDRASIGSGFSSAKTAS